MKPAAALILILALLGGCAAAPGGPGEETVSPVFAEPAITESAPILWPVSEPAPEEYVYETKAKIHPDLPEFILRARGAVDAESSENNIDTYYCFTDLDIINPETGELINSFDLAAHSWSDGVIMREGPRIDIVDINFDGYKDIKLFDCGYTLVMHSQFFKWEPAAGRFAQTLDFEKLNGQLEFDGDNQLIHESYGSASYRMYLTYQYAGGELTKIEEINEEYPLSPSELFEDVYGELASFVPGLAQPVLQRYRFERLNPETGEMEAATESYRIYQANSPDIAAEFDINSAEGQRIDRIIAGQGERP